MNACFLSPSPQISEFLFQTLRHLIHDRDTFEAFPAYAAQHEVLTEFLFQFEREFGCNAAARGAEFDQFDLSRAWPCVAPLVVSMEERYPILLTWSRY